MIIYLLNYKISIMKERSITTDISVIFMLLNAAWGFIKYAHEGLIWGFILTGVSAGGFASAYARHAREMQYGIEMLFGIIFGFLALIFLFGVIVDYRQHLKNERSREE